MARTWLDVYQADSWSRLMQKLNRTQVAGPVTFTAPKFDVGGRLAAKREEQARMDALYAAERILKDIPEMLRNYHAIRKDSQYNLENRRKMLERIAARADQYLQAIGDPTTANRFTGMGKGDTNSILPWVRALKKKAENKAAYIAALERYTRQTKDKYRDPRLLIDFITKTPQKVGGGLYGLVPGVRMEKVDFMHRNFEFQLDHGTLTPHNGLDMAFKEWIAEAEAKNYEVPPFFVWLEKHPVCTGVNGDAYTGISKEHVTQYGTEMPAGGSGRVDIFMGAIVGGVVKGVPLAQLGGDRDARPQPFDTRQYGPHSKLPEGAAYVWGNDQFLYLGPHGILHHSSLQAGKKVRCAGMIKILDGKVEIVNTDSGHYRPPLDALKTFVRYLQAQGACAANAQVGIFNPDPQAGAKWLYRTVPAFLAG